MEDVARLAEKGDDYMGDDYHHNIKIGAKDRPECPVHGQILQNFYKTVKE